MTHKERHMMTRDVHNFEHTHCLFLPILKVIVIAVHCTMYTVHCTLYTVYRTLQSWSIWNRQLHKKYEISPREILSLKP